MALRAAQQSLAPVTQAATQTGLSPLERPADGRAVHVQPLRHLLHGQLVEIVQQQDLPLPPGQLLPNGPAQGLAQSLALPLVVLRLFVQIGGEGKLRPSR